MSDEDKPFECTEMSCGMRFTNEDHLAVHLKKHDMSLALSLSSGLGNLSPMALFSDQTPTPTKFLRNCEEIGLFQDLNKNPFDDSFKKAMDDPLDMETSTSETSLAIPGPTMNDLDTPQPQIPKIVIDEEEGEENVETSEKKKSVRQASIVPKKRKKIPLQSMATSTTSEDEDESAIGSSSSVELETSPTPVKLIAKGGNSSPPIVTSSTRQGAAITSEASESRLNNNTTPWMVQVHLELPGGQTVPVAVPATNLSPLQLKSVTPQQIFQLQTATNTTGHVQLVNANKTPSNIPSVVAPSSQVQQPVFGTNSVTVSVSTSPAALTTANLPLNVRGFKLGTSPLAQGAVIAQQGGNQAGKTKVTPEKAAVVQTAQIVMNTPTVTSHKILGGSQPYTKQRLKAALQQQTTPSSSQKISQIFQMVNDMPIKREPQMSPIPVDSPSMVSSSGSVSSPEDKFSSIYGASLYSGLPGDLGEGEDAEVRRKKFLERNRAAAARCRQKRKKWVNNLESKADELTNINTKLSVEIKSLREEIAQLKTLLIAHKDCPVTLQQRSQGQITAKTYLIETPKTVYTSDETSTVDIPKTVTAISDTSEINSVTLNQPLQTASTIVNASLIPNILTLNQSSLQTGSTQIVNGGTIPSIIAIDQSDTQTLGQSSVGGNLLPSIISIDQNSCEARPLSVITGPNSLHMIPKIIAVEPLLQKQDNQKS